MLFIINPRRACAARITELGLCVCLFVYDYSHTTGYGAAYERYQPLQWYKGMKNDVGIFLKRLCSRDMVLKQAKRAIFIMSTGLPGPGLTHSGHRGRIKLLRRFISKFSAALNPLMITHLACERPRGRSWTTWHGAAHQLAVCMHILVSNNNNNYYGMHFIC